MDFWFGCDILTPLAYNAIALTYSLVGRGMYIVFAFKSYLCVDEKGAGFSPSLDAECVCRCSCVRAEAASPLRGVTRLLDAEVGGRTRPSRAHRSTDAMGKLFPSVFVMSHTQTQKRKRYIYKYIFGGRDEKHQQCIDARSIRSQCVCQPPACIYDHLCVCP